MPRKKGFYSSYTPAQPGQAQQHGRGAGQQEQLPDFLSGYHPDLLIRKGDEAIVVEVKRHLTLMQGALVGREAAGHRQQRARVSSCPDEGFPEPLDHQVAGGLLHGARGLETPST